MGKFKIKPKWSYTMPDLTPEQSLSIIVDGVTERYKQLPVFTMRSISVNSLTPESCLEALCDCSTCYEMVSDYANDLTFSIKEIEKAKLSALSPSEKVLIETAIADLMQLKNAAKNKSDTYSTLMSTMKTILSALKTSKVPFGQSKPTSNI